MSKLGSSATCDGSNGSLLKLSREMLNSSSETLAELARLKAANSLDSKKWVFLLSAAQSSNDLKVIKRVFEAFLACFPLCFGYWLKLANLTERLAPEDTKQSDVSQVFRHASSKFPLCKEIWLRYIEYLEAVKASEDELKKTYQQALDAVGQLPDSDQLWLKYLAFIVARSPEPGAKDDPVVAMYIDILSRPLFKLEIFWSQFIGAVLPKQPVEAQAGLKQKGSELYERSKEKVQRVTEYERRLSPEGGGRPFFHFDPLTEDQKNTWREYLGFVKTKCESTSEVALLYERCLVTCASYSEFWLSYIEWLEDNAYEFSAIQEVFARATTVFFKDRPLMHLHHAEFLEEHNKEDKAVETYKHIVDTLAPGWVRGILGFAHFERRQGRTKDAAAILKTALETAPDLTRPLLTMQLAMLTKDVAVLRIAVSSHPCCASNLNIWLCWTALVDDPEQRSTVFELALQSPYILGNDRELLWSHYEDHLLETSSDVRRLRYARRRQLVGGNEKRKREPEPVASSKQVKQR